LFAMIIEKFNFRTMPKYYRRVVRILIMKLPQKLDFYKFKEKGKKFLLDINTSAFFKISPVTDKIFDLIDRYDEEGIYRKLEDKYPKDIIKESLDTIKGFKNHGLLHERKEKDETYSPRPFNITNISLNITYDCNLRCKYCYAGENQYLCTPEVMDKETARDAMIFLIKYMGNEQYGNITFFGGEPLLNFDTMKFMVELAPEAKRRYNKNISFTVVTNGTLLNREINEFLIKNSIATQISFDGIPEIQNKMRPLPNKKGSSKIILPKIKEFMKAGGRPNIRATLTAYNMDISRLVKYMHSLGFSQILLDPVIADKDKPYAITKKLLKEVENSFREFAKEYLEVLLNNRNYIFSNFYHSMSDLYLCKQRIYYCGAGKNYLAVTPKGDIFPCHCFQGLSEFKMGNVRTGLNNELQNLFLNNHIYNRPACSKCWARNLCGGGCPYISVYYMKDIQKSYPVHCFFNKLYLKLAISIFYEISQKNVDILDLMYERQFAGRGY